MPRQCTIRHLDAVTQIDRAAFDACFPGEAEDYDYHAAVEAAGLEGFAMGWLAAEREGDVVGLVPVFYLDYDLTTTASGSLQALACRVKAYIPGQLELRLSCLGSPVTEHCPIGLRSSLAPEEARAVFEALLQAWSDQAKAKGVRLLGIKDLPDADSQRFERSLALFGLQKMSGQSTAAMQITCASLEGYLQSLGASTRKDLRRKLRRHSDVSVELHEDVGPYLDVIMSMYHETRERSDLSFETLTPHYFIEVLTRMRGRALLALYFHGAALVGANLLLIDGKTLLDKYFVMHTERGRSLDLYFLSWLKNIEICIERGLLTYISGQGAEATKVRLGCRLKPNWIFFKHQNRLINAAFGAIAPLLAIKSPASAVPS